jgi:glycosyltransferase involved in cell wall biosynthesis
MKALLLSQHFYPEPNFITKDLADALCASVQSVDAVVAHPNYPHGKFYDSVKSIWPSKERLGNLTVWRLPMYPSHDRSKIRRFFHYMSFAWVAQLLLPFICIRPKIVVVYQSPFTTALAALFYKYIFGARLIYVIADLWPESFAASGINVHPLLSKILYGYSRWINRRADHIICTTRGMQKRYEADGIKKNNLTYLPLWVDASGGELPKLKAEMNFSCVYAGNLGAAQGLDTVLDAAKIIAAKDASVHFDIYGTGLEADRLKAKASSMNLVNVTFHGRVSSQASFQYSSESSVQIIHLVATPLFAMTVPSKLAFCLSAGTPIVSGVMGESADILNDSGGSLVVPPSDPEAMAEAILKIRAMPLADREAMGRKSRLYYDQNLNKKLLVAKYVDVILRN